MNRINQPILLVEDSPEDYEATVRALRHAGLANPLLHCADGDDTLDLLHQRGFYAASENASPPGIILLDLNLPGTDGREVLEHIKSDDTLKMIPVIVLTTSADPRDIEGCYQAGANSYIQKPVNFTGLMEAIQRLKDFWFEVVVWPKGGREI